jgi:hypothetical protein
MPNVLCHHQRAVAGAGPRQASTAEPSAVAASCIINQVSKATTFLNMSPSMVHHCLLNILVKALAYAVTGCMPNWCLHRHTHCCRGLRSCSRGHSLPIVPHQQQQQHLHLQQQRFHNSQAAAAATRQAGPVDPVPDYTAIDSQPLNQIVMALFRRKMVAAIGSDSQLTGCVRQQLMIDFVALASRIIAHRHGVCHAVAGPAAIAAGPC